MKNPAWVGWSLGQRSFSCHWCSRLFLQALPEDARLPGHDDALLGVPCPESGQPIQGSLDIMAWT